MNPLKEEKIKQAVRHAYDTAARRFIEPPIRTKCGCCACQPQASSCGSSEAVVDSQSTAASLRPDEDLVDLQNSPHAIAGLQPGETVLDLGSGGGTDCLQAAQQVEQEGRVIGLDMTPEMIKLARHRAKEIVATNVEFRYGEIEDIPLPDESVDVLLSNCVINLSPDKDAVFCEIYCVLRPGGRMIVSDIVVERELPQPIRESLVAWAGCVAGALREPDYLDKIRAAAWQR
jgi:arsenite methyltransferase